jgi:hypothetical protein
LLVYDKPHADREGIQRERVYLGVEKRSLLGIRVDIGFANRRLVGEVHENEDEFA